MNKLSYYYQNPERVETSWAYNPFAAYRFRNYLRNKGMNAQVLWTWEGLFVEWDGVLMHLKFKYEIY